MIFSNAEVQKENLLEVIRQALVFGSVNMKDDPCQRLLQHLVIFLDAQNMQSEITFTVYVSSPGDWYVIKIGWMEEEEYGRTYRVNEFQTRPSPLLEFMLDSLGLSSFTLGSKADTSTSSK